MAHPLRNICSAWLSAIEQAKKVKHDRFGQYAEECAKFYDGDHNWMWEQDYAATSGGFLDEDSWQAGGLPKFKMSVNRLFEAVALFGPALFSRYPSVMVTPSDPPIVTPDALGLDMQDPMQQQAYMQLAQEEQAAASKRRNCSAVKQHYLNWSQVESNKKKQVRQSLTESLVKGLGLLYHEYYRPEGASIGYPRSVHLSVDDYVKDPDAVYQEDVEWIAIRRKQPVNRVEEKYGLPPGTLRGQAQSFAVQATNRGYREAKTNAEMETADLFEYWEVFSKNGMGNHLTIQDVKKTDLDLRSFGPNCYLAVAENIPFPLNMPDEAISQAAETQDWDSLFLRSQWPVPFWTDAQLGGGWPVSECGFYEKPNCVWPVPLFKPVIGEMRFINWCMSFLADRVAAAGTTYVGVQKAAKAEIKDQLTGGMAPFTMIEVSEITGMKINDLISFLNSPNVNTDIWTMVQMVMDRIDKATGLTPLVYGQSSRQMRSAREAEVKSDATNIRPDDMAEITENWLSQSVMKEIQVLAWLGSYEDMVPVVGKAGAVVLDRVFKEEGGFERLVRDFNYRIEAGSARKPNKANRMKSLNEFGQVALPVIQQFALQGMFDPWNAYVSEYAKAMDLDASPFLLRPPEPSPEEQQQQQQQMMVQQQQQQMALQGQALDLAEKQVEIEDKQMESAERRGRIQTSFMDALMSGEATMADIALKRAQREQLAND